MLEVKLFVTQKYRILSEHEIIVASPTMARSSWGLARTRNNNSVLYTQPFRESIRARYETSFRINLFHFLPTKYLFDVHACFLPLFTRKHPRDISAK